MSIDLLERAADALGNLLSDVAFLGGASLALWITDPAAPPLRPTKDVDVIVEVGSRVDYYRLGDDLRKRGFEEDPGRALMCAWRHLETGLLLDVMPIDESILGFSNDWYRPALENAVPTELPSGVEIRAVSPPFLVATKLEAFAGRGNGDFLASLDFGDIVTLIDGRLELIDETHGSPDDLRAYLRESLVRLRNDPLFEGGVAGALPFGSQARVPTVLERVAALSAD